MEYGNVTYYWSGQDSIPWKRIGTTSHQGNWDMDSNYTIRWCWNCYLLIGIDRNISPWKSVNCAGQIIWWSLFILMQILPFFMCFTIMFLFFHFYIMANHVLLVSYLGHAMVAMWIRGGISDKIVQGWFMVLTGVTKKCIWGMQSFPTINDWLMYMGLTTLMWITLM